MTDLSRAHDHRQEAMTPRAAFRVGGVYRNGAGAPCKIVADLGDGIARVHTAVHELSLTGEWDLATGKWLLNDCRALHLLPGELIERDGQWVPAELEASLTYQSGGTLTIRGDKVVARIEPEPQRAPLPDSDTWRGIGHLPLDTFGPDFIVTSGICVDASIPSEPRADALKANANLLRI